MSDPPAYRPVATSSDPPLYAPAAGTDAAAASVVYGQPLMSSASAYQPLPATSTAPTYVVAGAPVQQHQQHQPMMPVMMMQPPAVGYGGGAPMMVMMQPPPAVAAAAAAVVDLSFLQSLDGLFVKQRVEMLEAITGFETENKYDVYAKSNPSGPLLYAKEQSSVCSRMFLKNGRPFLLRITNPSNNALIMQLDRPFKCFLSELTVYDGQQQPLGRLAMRCVCGYRLFNVLDSAGAHVYDVFSPCCSPWTFYIVMPGTRDETQYVGVVRKKWSGFLKEWLTDADNFGVEFDINLPVQHKALILAATFLIDFVYFERSGND